VDSFSGGSSDANIETHPPGFLPLREFYAQLAQTHIPFALILDGCLRMDEFERMRSELGIISDKGQNVFVYVGPEGAAGDNLSRLGTLQEHVADTRLYLHSNNVVLLAAKPGTYASSRRDPDNTLSEVGPCLRASPSCTAPPITTQTAQAWPISWEDSRTSTVSARSHPQDRSVGAIRLNLGRWPARKVIPVADQRR
jgi:hypothetical protein